MNVLLQFVRRQAFGVTIIVCTVLAFARPGWFLDWGPIHLLDWVGPMIQLIMFGMGTTLGLKDFSQVVKAPWAVAIGAFLQFTVKPLTGLLIVKALGFNGELAAGVILIGSVAGGAASNVIAYLARANVALSVTMTCCSTLLCPFVTPFLMKWLAGQYVQVETVPMMIAMLKIVLLPVIAGSAVHSILRKQFELHKRTCDRVLSLVSMFGICFSLVVILAPSRERLIEAGAVLLLASSLHNVFGYVVGYWFSRLCGKVLSIDERDCRTVAIEVGLQNGAMASALAIDVLHSPTAALPPNVFSIWMNFSGSLLANYWNHRPIVARKALTAIVCLAAVAAAGTAVATENDDARTVWLNEDNEHFYLCHSEGDMTEEGCRRLVRTYAGLNSLTGILYCINMQRALFDSKTWERFWDQTNRVESTYPTHLKLLHARGVDQFAVWLDETRRQGMSAWLSMRMNDSHGLKEAAHNDYSSKIAYWHSRMWASHPEFRRAPYRDERSWEGSYDFGHDEVRTHTVNLIREAFARWDFDGFEFDWLRWGMYFKPGHEREGASLLTEIVREAGKIRDEAEKRVGHRIALGHRVPPDPVYALNHGFDVAAWAELGCVQMLTLSTFGNECLFDPPIEQWRKTLLPGTVINVAVGRTASANAFNRATGIDLLRGGAAAAWAKKADGLYLFNECYLEPERLSELCGYLQEIKTPESVARSNRRIAVTCEVQAMPGDSLRAVLPMPLTNRYVGMDFSRMEENMTIRLPVPLKTSSMKYRLDLCFDECTPDMAVESLSLRVNSCPVKRAGGILHLMRNKSSNPFETYADGYPRDAAKVVMFDLEASCLKDEYNAVEIMPRGRNEGNLVWAQIVCERNH